MKKKKQWKSFALLVVFIFLTWINRNLIQFLDNMSFQIQSHLYKSLVKHKLFFGQRQ